MAKQPNDPGFDPVTDGLPMMWETFKKTARVNTDGEGVSRLFLTIIITLSLPVLVFCHHQMGPGFLSIRALIASMIYLAFFGMASSAAGDHSVSALGNLFITAFIVQRLVSAYQKEAKGYPIPPNSIGMPWICQLGVPHQLAGYLIEPGLILLAALICSALGLTVGNVLLLAAPAVFLLHLSVENQTRAKFGAIRDAKYTEQAQQRHYRSIKGDATLKNPFSQARVNPNLRGGKGQP